MLSHTQRDSLFKFSVRVYKQLQAHNEQRENLVCSPFSIACALAIFASGACNDTAKQIFAVLNLKASKYRIQEQFFNLLTTISGYTPDVVLYVANRVYSDQKFPVRSSYIGVLEVSYGATMKSVDFESDSDSVRSEANAWVSQQTESKVQDIVPAECVLPNTELILLNATCFAGFWQWPFRSVYTVRQLFRLNYRKGVRVNMMFQCNSFKIGESLELCVRALELPYRGNTMSMVILLPDDDEGLEFLEEKLTPADLSTLLASMQLVDDVEVTLPKFRIEHSMNLREALKDLDVKDLFTPGKADLSDVFETGTPSVSDVVHKALVRVDDEGTEPEAEESNVVTQSSGTIRADPVRFVVDHPFMFLIKMNDLDVILYLGSVRKL